MVAPLGLSPSFLRTQGIRPGCVLSPAAWARRAIGELRTNGHPRRALLGNRCLLSPVLSFAFGTRRAIQRVGSEDSFPRMGAACFDWTQQVHISRAK